MPERLKTIDSHGFFKCEQIKEIKFPKGLKNIEAHAFGECEKITSISLPYGLERLGECVFKNCYNLRDIYANVACRATLLLSGGVNANIHTYRSQPEDMWQKIFPRSTEEETR